MGGLPTHRQPRTTIHGRSLLVPRHKLRTKLENDTWPSPSLLTNNVPKPATNLNPFSRRVSRTHMVTLAHTYILTRTLHMCARTDYHSVYTHIHVNSVNIYANIYTPTHTNSVYLYVCEHKHMQTLCVYT